MRRATSLVVAVLVALLVLAGCSSGDDEPEAVGPSTPEATAAGPTAPAPDPFTSAVYAGTTNWLCHPEKDDDPCDGDRSVTVVAADGSRTVEASTDATGGEPAADCFYVYPTVSNDPPPNADLVPGIEEERAVVNQAAPFAGTCRLFAPTYRQVPVTGLFSGDRVTAFATAYADVLDAWKHYLANENDGRPVVLIGHSQGAGHLKRLIAEQIDPDPEERARLVSAVLLGNAVAVPAGADVGGDFQDVPLCRSTEQTGCVITYATFRDTAPPPPTSLFGRVRDGEGVAGCTNPAALAGGDGPLRPYFRTENLVPGADTDVTTPYVSFTDVVTGRCIERDGFSYLEVQVAPGDPLGDQPSLQGGLGPDWGLHLVDANIAMGNLVEVVATQVDSFAAN